MGQFADVQRKFFLTINTETIQTRLHQCGLKAYVHHTRPLLTVAHKQKRLAWAQAHADWIMEHWHAVCFSDESKFCLFGSDGHEWCWKTPEQAFDEHYVKGRSNTVVGM